MLDKKPGPCRMTVNNTRYYYDRNMKKCLPFEYGGEKSSFYENVFGYRYEYVFGYRLRSSHQVSAM